MRENDTWAFGDWWQLLNKELADLGEPEASFYDARYHHTANYSPFAAARLIHENRHETN